MRLCTIVMCCSRLSWHISCLYLKRPASTTQTPRITNLFLICRSSRRCWNASSFSGYSRISRSMVCSTAYRKYHSTETAMVMVTSDTLMALDRGDVAALALLDLSATFDTVDHAILLHRLRESYGISGGVLAWISLYVTDRQQSVCHGGMLSAQEYIMLGVPQGSVLGPLLFVLYAADLVSLIADHRLHSHLYADDTQVYGWSSPTDANALQVNTSQCIQDVVQWTSSNRLQLNAQKTEFIWCASACRHHYIPHGDVQVGHDSVCPNPLARDLGMYVDGAMTMRTHINHVLSSSYGALRKIRSIMPSLPSHALNTHALNTLVTALVHSWLDYCNVVFAGLPACDIQLLQSVLNTAVRLVAGSSPRDHVTCLLCDRHWLPVKQRDEYKLCTIVHHCFYGDAPACLAELITTSAASTGRAGLRSAASGAVAVPRTTVSFGDRSFAVAGPRARNKLPPPLRRVHSAATFKRQLKTFLNLITLLPDIVRRPCCVLAPTSP